MNSRSLFDRIADLPAPPEGEHIPPAELVAFTVRVARGINGWKQSTLAEFSGVSLSTVERVERAEPVSTALLDKIGIGLGYEAGYFTAPRQTISSEEAVKSLVESYGSLVPVAVTPITTHSRLRALVKCHAMMFHHPDVPDDVLALIQGLSEWLDLGSFLLSDLVPQDRESAGRRREYYADVLAHIGHIQRMGYTVIGGITTQSAMGLDDWRIAVISITSRTTDPGAPRRETLFVDRRYWQTNSLSTSWDEDD